MASFEEPSLFADRSKALFTNDSDDDYGNKIGESKIVIR